jgi:hypothetical protein
MIRQELAKYISQYGVAVGSLLADRTLGAHRASRIERHTEYSRMWRTVSKFIEGLQHLHNAGLNADLADLAGERGYAHSRERLPALSVDGHRRAKAVRVELDSLLPRNPSD